MPTRRSVLQAASVAAAATCLPTRVWARPSTGLGAILTPSPGAWREPDLGELAQVAVDAAVSAGASYADVRITTYREQNYNCTEASGEDQRRGVGVRALVNGYWGFMGSAVWTRDEMARLARGAVAQAKANGLGGTREVDLGQIPRVENGKWRMPIKYDPFELPLGEKMDVWQEMVNQISRVGRGIAGSGKVYWGRQQKQFASSEGSSFDQTTYWTAAGLLIQAVGQYSKQLDMSMSMPDYFTASGQGWEYIVDSPFVDDLPRLAEDARQMRYRVPVDIGRYDVVFSGAALAAIADPTLGASTELDRALGYEANASGTSYLVDPLSLVGQFRMGSPLLTFEASRSIPHGLATVQWDDEAVVPEDFTIVKDGVLVDYQTTREEASWMAPVYRPLGRPVRSHGCAGAQSALFITTQHAPNFRIVPGPTGVTFDDLVKDTKKGIAVIAMLPQMDQQQLNGFARPVMRQINNGKLGPFIEGGGIIFRSPEFWKDLVALGGPESVRLMGFTRSRGEPRQSGSNSVSAPAGKVANVRVIDAQRGVAP